MAKRNVQILPRVLIGPVTDMETPAVVVDPADTEWVARLDPDKDYPTCTWFVSLWLSSDNGVTWLPWRSVGLTGIVRDPERGLYPALGGTFPGFNPTHLKGFVTLSEQITIGLKAVAG